jgi:hypothetical protein
MLLRESTSEFDLLYSAVTSNLRSFANDGQAKGTVTLDEVDWFEYLIDGFRAEYDVWDRPKHFEISGYLDLFEQCWRGSPVRIAGYAFLHVGYDLPRVLAASMAKFPLQRSRLRTLFLRPAPLFRQMFLDQFKRGMFGLLVRPFGYVKPLEVLAYWLLALRSVAWIHAEILADADPTTRSRLEHQLAMALLDTGNTAMKSFWIFSVPKLDNSQLFQVAPAPFFFQYPKATAAIALAAVASASFAFSRRSAATRIALMGQHFSVEATKRMAVPDPERLDR